MAILNFAAFSFETSSEENTFLILFQTQSDLSCIESLQRYLKDKCDQLPVHW